MCHLKLNLRGRDSTGKRTLLPRIRIISCLIILIGKRSRLMLWLSRGDSTRWCKNWDNLWGKVENWSIGPDNNCIIFSLVYPKGEGRLLLLEVRERGLFIINLKSGMDPLMCLRILFKLINQKIPHVNLWSNLMLRTLFTRLIS